MDRQVGYDILVAEAPWTKTFYINPYSPWYATEDEPESSIRAASKGNYPEETMVHIKEVKRVGTGAEEMDVRAVTGCV